jgi:two-component system chemotaxis response regulator CheB
MAKVFVIGASQGGVSAILTIVRQLPRDFPGSVLIALHIGPSQSILPSILNDAGTLHAVHARNGDPLKPGCILVAPPDHHMLVTDGHVELTRGPRENWARPAIDPLFRTAAEVFGPDVAGVILSGRLNDGTAGLYEIKRRGGIAIIQDPQEAEASGMPQSARDNVAIDYCLPVAEIPELLDKLAREAPTPFKLAGDPIIMTDYQIDRPVAFSCPECGGAMREERLGGLTRFRCHIGHVMTSQVMSAQQTDKIEAQLSALLRLLNEHAALCAEMAEKSQSAGDAAAAGAWRTAKAETELREKAIRDLLSGEWSHPETAILSAQRAS